MEKIKTTLYGKACLVPTMYLKDLKAKEKAVEMMGTETDPEKRTKLNRKIIRINRKVPGCVQFL